jgi:hypothetical protein
MGGLGFAPGMVGQAFDFDGASAYAQVANPVGLPVGSQPRTVTLWFKTSRNLSSDTESALFQYGSDANGLMFGLITSLNVPDKLYFFGYNYDMAGATSLASGTWYHAAATYDGNIVTLYVNGQPAGSASLPLNTVLNGNGLTIGYRPGGAKWQGQIDEVMLFNRALTADEVAAIYNAGTNGVIHPVTRPSLSLILTGNQLQLSWPSQSGQSYQLQTTTDLLNWTNVGTAQSGTDGTLTNTIGAINDSRSFFRVKVGN